MAEPGLELPAEPLARWQEQALQVRKGQEPAPWTQNGHQDVEQGVLEGLVECGLGQAADDVIALRSTMLLQVKAGVGRTVVKDLRPWAVGPWDRNHGCSPSEVSSTNSNCLAVAC